MNPGVLALMIPIIAITGGLIAGIVQSLTKHQRQMAEIMRGTGQQANNQLLAEIQALRNEVASLKDRVNSVAIASDTATALQPPSIPQNIADRLQQ